MGLPRARPLLLPALLAVLAAGCAHDGPDPRYRPAENLLEVIAVLRRHVPDDTYRFEPARDFTGRNVYRSSLLRLENMEQVHANALRAGHWDGPVAFAKARALERLRAFDLAAQHYRSAALRDAELREEALRSAALCEGLHAASELAFEVQDLADGDVGRELRKSDPEAVLAAFEERQERLEALRETALGTHYEAVIREEMEHADMARARYFAGVRKVVADGDVRAVAEHQRVVVRHRESKLRNQHLLDLADLYAELAEEYVEAHPPESLTFDPARFQELIDAASRLYEMVANQDGTPEKLEASRRLEAFLAFALQVDRDRFTP